MGRLTWVMAIVGLLAAAADGIMFHLQPNTQKCLREEIHKDVLVSGEYEIQETPGQKVDIQVSYADRWVVGEGKQIVGFDSFFPSHFPFRLSVSFAKSYFRSGK